MWSCSGSAFFDDGSAQKPEEVPVNVYPIIDVLHTWEGVLMQTRTLTFTNGYGDALHSDLRGQGWMRSATILGPTARL